MAIGFGQPEHARTFHQHWPTIAKAVAELTALREAEGERWPAIGGRTPACWDVSNRLRGIAVERENTADAVLGGYVPGVPTPRAHGQDARTTWRPGAQGEAS